MLVDLASANFSGAFSLTFIVKIFFLLFLIFYCVFAAILYTQIVAMSEKLPTPVNPSVKFVGLINIGVSLALLFITIGLF